MGWRNRIGGVAGGLVRLGAWSGIWMLMLGTLEAQPFERQWTSYAYPARFEHLSVEHGLSQSTVRAILQDRRGFLWFGTESGLNRYDGFRFQVFHARKGDPRSLGGDWILCLLEDRRGYIWVGTRNGGLSCIDPESHEILTFQVSGEAGGLPSSTINALAEDRQGRVWVATETGGLCAVPSDWTMATPLRFQLLAPFEGPGSPPRGRVNALCVDREGQLWIGSKGHGLGRLLEERGEPAVFRYFPTDPRHPETSCPEFFSALVEDRHGVLWLGAHGGLWRFDPRAGTFQRCHTSPADFDIARFRIVSLALGSSGALWAASDGGGLYKLLPRSRREEPPAFLRFAQDPQDPGSLGSNAGDAVYEDRSGVLWVSTFQTGLHKLVLNPYRPGNVEQPMVFHYRHNAADPRSLGGNLVSAIGQDRFGNLWVGTDGQGLSRAVPAAPGQPVRFERFRADPRRRPGRLQDDVILAMHLDSRGQLWLGSYDGGLIRVEQDSATSVPRFHPFRHDPGNPQSLSSDFIRDIQEDGQGAFWVATDQGGLNRFDPASGRSQRFGVDQGLSHPVIWSMVKDGHGTLWLGTADGLNRFDPRRGTFKVYRAGGPGSLLDACVQSLHIDGEGVLWIGTAGGGLHRTAVPPWEGEPQFTIYGLAEGLPDLRVNAILPGEPGELWISTSRQLCRFDVRRGKAQAFPWQASLRRAEFIKNAAYRSPGGELFFGSNDGLSLFHPRDIALHPLKPTVAISDFQIQGRSIPLQQRLERGVLSLGPSDRSISFDLAALHFAAPEENRFACRLEGLDSGWKDLGTKRSVAYTTLPPGHYTLRVKASNCDGVWNDQALALPIHVRPPWHQTWWFRALLLSGLGAVILGALRFRLRRLRRQNALLEEQVRLRTQTITQQNQALESANLKLLEVDKLKGNMAAVLVHDLRTPLSIICSMLELLELDGKPDPELMGHCRRSAKGMMTMLNDLLEVFRGEGTEFRMDARPMSMKPLLEQIQRSFQPLCQEKGISLVLDLPEETCRMIGDEGKVERALANLITNALKFTAAGGSITLTARQLPGSGVETGINWLLVQVRDTGRGIPAEALPFIFDPYRQVQNQDARQGVGLGLAIVQRIMAAHKGRITVRSQVGVGTDFTLLFPMAE